MPTARTVPAGTDGATGGVTAVAPATAVASATRTDASGAPAAHVLVIGAHRRDRLACHSGLDLPAALVPPIHAHRRLRGPYTAAGTLLRAIVPRVLAARADLLEPYVVEILTAAPELRSLVPAAPETLTSLAAPEERTRYYSRLRTRRIAHGLTDFLSDAFAAGVLPPGSVLVDAVDEADPTDREFLAVLLRRMPSRRLTLVVSGTGHLLDSPAADDHAEPGLESPELLTPDLLDGLRLVRAPAVPAAASGADPAALAEQYVNGDCVDDELRTAYLLVPTELRQRMHDRRAAELEAAGEASSAWGALPHHREHGSDRLGSGAASLLKAVNDCMRFGFYDAAADFCRRGQALADWEQDERMRWKFTRKLPTCLSALGRVEEAEATCDEARSNSVDPLVHIECAYATAMLYTRHLAPERRDHNRAMGWINEAIALASLLPDASERAFHSVFHRNGLALIEAHRGNPQAALRLVTSGIETLDRELGAEEHQLHRSVLRHNRAQVLGALGRLDEALADLDAVLRVDPGYPEYHFDRGNLLRRMGRPQEALAAYDQAVRLGPPFPELFYNRGNARTDVGDQEGALDDFSRVLVLEPDNVDAYVNRAGIRLERGETALAETDARDGLATAPDHAHLLTVLGEVHAELGQHVQARDCFDRALRSDPDLVAAWSGRAAVAMSIGGTAAALVDLARAAALAPDDPAVRYNHAFVLREAGLRDEALAELDVAALLAPDDPDISAALSDWRRS
ncbi:tetratricopeptide repeat protein [Streptomyces sp. V4-01]|uniref:Tetratricopeptide repeat protein n=1 Tax=Actinacidiphila polyblastidii TaxID=3110430 RepID=A0ABU7PFP1_9ACTN|nr:tetratricopeptide repeat protein [Streptomyces sp. V4-01]